MSFPFVVFLIKFETVPFTQATKKDQGEKKPMKAHSLVCSVCVGNGKPSFI